MAPGAGSADPRFRALPDRGKEESMEREPKDLVELGSVSTDTAGDDGLPIESGGRMLRPGLTED